MYMAHQWKTKHGNNEKARMQSATTMTTITILWPLYRSTCVSRHLRLRTGWFYWCKVLLPACPCWWQTAHSDYAEDAGVLLKYYLHCWCTLMCSQSLRVRMYEGEASILRTWKAAVPFHNQQHYEPVFMNVNIPLRYDVNCLGPERMQYLAVSWHGPCDDFFASTGLKLQHVCQVYTQSP